MTATAAPSVTLAIARPPGPVRWADGLALQRAAHAARVAGTGPDTVILLEHAPVVTLGPRTAPGDLRVPEDVLRARGVDVHRTDRGGGVTWHGPGQVVAYPVLSLRAWGLRPRDYLRFLESLVANVLRGFGVEGATVEGRTGIWVRDRKVCAMGVRVAGGVTLHGLALNVRTGPGAFEGIHPCGIRDAGVTSVADLLGARAPSAGAAMDALEAAFRAEAAARSAR